MPIVFSILRIDILSTVGSVIEVVEILITVKLGSNELGCQRILGFNEHIFNAN